MTWICHRENREPEEYATREAADARKAEHERGGYCLVVVYEAYDLDDVADELGVDLNDEGEEAI